VLVASAVLVASLTGCANHDALSLARKACAHVDRSITLYRKARSDPDPVRAAAERAQASEELGAAMPDAAIAAGESSQWQALMTTLSETSRVGEVDLLSALAAQCAATRGPFAGG
jgi:hypothetical protein